MKTKEVNILIRSFDSNTNLQDVLFLTINIYDCFPNSNIVALYIGSDYIIGVMSKRHISNFFVPENGKENALKILTHKEKFLRIKKAWDAHQRNVVSLA